MSAKFSRGGGSRTFFSSKSNVTNTIGLKSILADIRFTHKSIDIVSYMSTHVGANMSTHV